MRALAPGKGPAKRLRGAAALVRPARETWTVGRPGVEKEEHRRGAPGAPIFDARYFEEGGPGMGGVRVKGVCGPARSAQVGVGPPRS